MVGNIEGRIEWWVDETRGGVDVEGVDDWGNREYNIVGWMSVVLG